MTGRATAWTGSRRTVRSRDVMRRREKMEREEVEVECVMIIIIKKINNNNLNIIERLLTLLGWETGMWRRLKAPVCVWKEK